MTRRSSALKLSSGLDDEPPTQLSGAVGLTAGGLWVVEAYEPASGLGEGPELVAEEVEGHRHRHRDRLRGEVADVAAQYQHLEHGEVDEQGTEADREEAGRLAGRVGQAPAAKVQCLFQKKLPQMWKDKKPIAAIEWWTPRSPESRAKTPR